ncbi:MAG: recombinase family protein [Alphaproteobacteria bacterium]|jgi:DNA invertase Pin-like site-specific DNA recombinase|nr:recombinase family protein [Alphaproteobacteria bacterium]
MRYNAFIYCRCAAYQQGQGVPDSIQQQDKLCRLFADAEKDNVLETITDLGISGSSENRPGLDYLFMLLRELPKPSAVIVSDPSRLARNLNVFLRLKEKISDAGATLIIVNQHDAQHKHIPIETTIRLTTNLATQMEAL